MDRNVETTQRLAVLLAAVAGFVDVVGYLTLHHLFTAHMTGNTSKLGVALGHGNLTAALPLAVAPLLFVAGISAGTLLLDLGARWVALLAQASLTAAFMVDGASVIRHGTVPGHSPSAFYTLTALATLSLGLQTAALTEIRGSTVRTSYISGVLTNLAQEGTRRLVGRGRRKRKHSLTLLFAVWLAYVVGATLGSFGRRELSLWALAFPTGALLLAAAVTYRQRTGDPHARHQSVRRRVGSAMEKGTL